MTSKRLYYILLSTLLILIIGIGVSVYFGNKIMQDKANELKIIDLEDKVTTKKLSLLQNAKKELNDNKDLQATIDEALPKTKNQAEVVAELYQMAAQSNIKISSITFPSSTLGDKKASTGSASTDGSSAQSSTASNTPTSNSTSTQTKPVPSVSGVNSVDVALTFAPTSGESIPYNNMLEFLSLVEQNRRTMLINTLQITPDLKNGGVSFSVNLKLFVKS